MKKFLEVLVDEDGSLHFSTDYEFPEGDVSQEEMSIYLERSRKAIGGLVDEGWKNSNHHPSKAIRCLAMAEIMACAEPYERAEEFWSTMMFGYIPYFEKYAAKLKNKYVSGVFPAGFPSANPGSKMN